MATRLHPLFSDLFGKTFCRALLTHSTVLFSFESFLPLSYNSWFRTAMKGR